MSELTDLIAVGVAGIGLGYFIPRSRDVMTRLDAQDPTEAEEQQTAETTIFEELFELLPVTVLVVSEQNAITHANPAATQLFGRTSAQMTGRAVVEATGSIELDRLISEAQRGSELSQLVEYHSTRVQATLRVIVKCLSDKSVLLIALDESAVVDSERVRREFLANISHELRTPLAGTKLMVETLNSDDDAQTRAYFLPRLEREIERMVELVEHLLDVARSESGQINLKKRTVELTAVVDEALELLQHRIAELDLCLAHDLQPITLEADPARLSQVILNFVENAMRHTPARGTITIRTFIENNNAVIEVTDTGTGVPFKDLPHLFERFYVVDRSRAKNRGGLGVGLAIVKRNVEAHGGSVHAASEFGRGSTFTARLPLN